MAPEKKPKVSPTAPYVMLAALLVMGTLLAAVTLFPLLQAITPNYARPIFWFSLGFTLVVGLAAAAKSSAEIKRRNQEP